MSPVYTALPTMAASTPIRSSSDRCARDETPPAMITFKGVDFTSWMYELKLWPDESVFEKRGTGSMYKRLMAVGVIRTVRYQQDGGCKHTNHNSSVRPVFEILRTTSQREVLGL